MVFSRSMLVPKVYARQGHLGVTMWALETLPLVQQQNAVGRVSAIVRRARAHVRRVLQVPHVKCNAVKVVAGTRVATACV